MKESYCSSLSGVLKSQQPKWHHEAVTVSKQAGLLGLLEQCILLKASSPPELFSVPKAFRFPRTVCGIHRLPPFPGRLFVWAGTRRIAYCALHHLSQLALQLGQAGVLFPNDLGLLKQFLVLILELLLLLLHFDPQLRDLPLQRRQARAVGLHLLLQLGHLLPGRALLGEQLHCCQCCRRPWNFRENCD